MIGSVEAQVTIGLGEEPSEGALLQLKDIENVTDGSVNATKGFVFPRVAMTTISPAVGELAASIGGTGTWNEAAHIGLTVYNLKENLSATEPIAKGLYIWDGTKWQSLQPLPTLPTTIGTEGTFSGRTLFDIAFTDHDATAANNTRGAKLQRAAEYHYADFSLPQYNQQTYTFVPTTGTVNNVRFRYAAGNGQVIQGLAAQGNYSGNIAVNSPCNVKATFFNSLNTKARGTIIHGTGLLDPLTVDIYVVYNNGTIDVQQKLTVIVQDCSFCGAYTAPGVWKTFQCHNAGADISKDPLVLSKDIHGSYYKWSNPNPVATVDISAGSIANWATLNPPLIPTAATPWPANIAPLNSQPCPTGYRVPTIAEWDKVILVANNPSIISAPGSTWVDNGNFVSGKKIGDYLVLPATGFRDYFDGTLSKRGRYGYYWSSTESGTSAYNMHFFITDVSTGGYIRTCGYSVRCVSEF